MEPGGEDPKSGRVEVKGGSGSTIRSKAAAAFDDAEGEDPYAWLNQEGEYPREAMGNWTGGMAQGEEAYPTDAFAATPTDPPTAGVQARVRVGELQGGGEEAHCPLKKLDPPPFSKFSKSMKKEKKILLRPHKF